MKFLTRYVAYTRTSLILRELKRSVDKNVKILDVGCGNCYILNKLRSKGYNIIGVDRKPPCDIKMDVTNMDFPDNYFDVIISTEVIEHCNCVQEIKRVLKKGGLFFVSTPQPGTDWVRSILINIGLLENQEFDQHNFLVDIETLPFKKIFVKRMFFGTSQFGVFTTQ